MRVDTVCATQAIHDARISKKTADRFYSIFNEISFKGFHGRREFDYRTFLMKISEIDDIQPYEMSYIWEQFGHWMSQAVGIPTQVEENKNEIS